MRLGVVHEGSGSADQAFQSSDHRISRPLAARQREVGGRRPVKATQLGYARGAQPLGFTARVSDQLVESGPLRLSSFEEAF